MLLILIVVIIFVPTSRERLVCGLKPTNCDSPAVKTHNNQYQSVRSYGACVTGKTKLPEQTAKLSTPVQSDKALFDQPVETPVTPVAGLCGVRTRYEIAKSVPSPPTVTNRSSASAQP